MFKDAKRGHLRGKGVLVAFEVSQENVAKDSGKRTIILLYHRRDLLCHV